MSWVVVDYTRNIQPTDLWMLYMGRVITPTLFSGLFAGFATVMETHWVAIAVAGTVGALIGTLLDDENKRIDGQIYGFWWNCAKLGVASGLMSAVGTITFAVGDMLDENVLTPYFSETIGGIVFMIYMLLALLLIMNSFFYFCRLLKVDLGA